MRKLHYVLSLALLIPNLAAASAMSPEKSQCFDKEAIARQYKGWRAGYEKFVSESDSLSQKKRFNISLWALKKVSSISQDFANEVGMRAPREMIAQVAQLQSDIDARRIPEQAAMKVMTSALLKFEEKMDMMLLIAQANHQECDISDSPVHTNSLNSSDSSAGSR